MSKQVEAASETALAPTAHGQSNSAQSLYRIMKVVDSNVPNTKEDVEVETIRK
jgi:hypothetical protein